jgi:hypothetical protein
MHIAYCYIVRASSPKNIFFLLRQTYEHVQNIPQALTPVLEKGQMEIFMKLKYVNIEENY